MTSKAFEDINKVVLDGISENMYVLVQPDKYGAANTTYSTKMGYYVIYSVYDAYTLQEDTTCYGKISTDGELSFKAIFLRCMQENPKCYWEKKCINNP